MAIKLSCQRNRKFFYRRLLRMIGLASRLFTQQTIDEGFSFKGKVLFLFEGAEDGGGGFGEVVILEDGGVGSVGRGDVVFGEVGEGDVELGIGVVGCELDGATAGVA